MATRSADVTLVFPLLVLVALPVWPSPASTHDAEAVGVPAKQPAEDARVSPALMPTVPAEDASADGAEVLRLLGAMKAQQDGIAAELSALRLDVTELRGA